MTEREPDGPGGPPFPNEPAVPNEQLFQRLCHEAVIACGDDMAAVERYVLRRLDDLPPAQRAAVLESLRRVLAFRAPDRGAGLH